MHKKEQSLQSRKNDYESSKHQNPRFIILFVVLQLS